MLTLFSLSMTVQSVPTTSRIRFLFKAGRLLLFRRLCRSGFRKLTIVFFNIADFLFFIPQGYCNPFDSCPFLILFFQHFLGIPSRPFVRRPRPASAHLSHLEFTVNILKSYFRLFGDQLNWHSFFTKNDRFRQRWSIDSVRSRETHRFLNMCLRKFPEIIGTGRSRRLCKFFYITLEKPTDIIIMGSLNFQILEEAGVEGNRSINEAEFQLVVKKLPDFATSFKLIM